MPSSRRAPGRMRRRERSLAGGQRVAAAAADEVEPRAGEPGGGARPPTAAVLDELETRAGVPGGACPPTAAARRRAETPTSEAEMDDDEAAMDLELLLTVTGPKNEQNLDECLGVSVAGVFDYYSPQLEDQFDPSLNVNDGEAAVNELEIEDYIDPGILGCFLPCSSLGHGRRGPRRRSSSERLGLFGHNFGPQEPSTSGGRKHIGRKNNDHWTVDEVRKLVEGVYFFGVGKWRDVKREYFKASIRTADHLKDKWKNLVKACKKENGRMLLHLEPSLIERIKEIDAKDPYPKQSNSS